MFAILIIICSEDLEYLINVQDLEKVFFARFAKNVVDVVFELLMMLLTHFDLAFKLIIGKLGN